MKTADIRDRFVEFFRNRGHSLVESSPLVPANDPTLLFTNSGMVQFKDVFLGFEPAPARTAVTAQRCLRAGGKHNDLENVGYTARHHTFFEMLGNFSFGDYFKEKAIPFAWEFLTSTEGLGLRKEHLWVTVFGGGRLFGEGSPAVPADEEAEAVWLRVLMAAGFDEREARRRITRVPTTDNFWMMGETGPCGPCSEIFYDQETAVEGFRGEDEAFADVCVEVWNLVFMQYGRDEAGGLTPLPAPCVDTGMGLERVSAVMQGVESNYEIDLFVDLIAAVRRETRTPEMTATGASHRVVADHIRSAAFLIADGVVPANDGRGYVLRRIIRRALRHLHAINPMTESRFHRLVRPLAEMMGDGLLREREAVIVDLLAQEEASFSHLLRKGMGLLDEEMAAIEREGRERVLSGEWIFKLYDTFGFPYDMTASIARDHGLGFDADGFEVLMAAQRQRSKKAAKFGAAQRMVGYEGEATRFLGYEVTEAEAVVVALFVEGEPVTAVGAGEEAVAVLDRTPFYAESGGQVGDCGGFVGGGGGVAEVSDTQKIRADVWGHWVTAGEGGVQVGEAVVARVDAVRRGEIARAHSAAHLLHAALRRVLGGHVQQRGSQVTADGVRFDFSHPTAVTPEELREVEALVNGEVTANAVVETEVMAFDEALKTGAMALFGEKYGERVRVVTIDRDFSVELCGGTHVERAGDVGLFQFVGESAIAAGVRRVEAVTAGAAVTAVQARREQLERLAALLKTPANHLEERVVHLRDDLKDSQRRLERLQMAQAQQQVATLAAEAETVGGRRVVVRVLSDVGEKGLRDVARALCQRLPAPAAVLLAGESGGRVSWVAATSEGEGAVDAKGWLLAVAAACGAAGGGKARFAQAGGGDGDRIEDALGAARAYLE